ncbi:MAG TPA: hypothetical protein VMV40_09090 [Acidiferrobacter sp.]|nr:hypothetical protein [Acidiferrobacter sp.]
METLELETAMSEVDGEIRGLEQALVDGDLKVGPAVDAAIGLANRLMRTFAAAGGSVLVGLSDNADPLEVFKAFVKGDPSLTAIRDNVRELVYYRNCLASGRADALPAKPAAMAVRTIRHIYLYLRTRAMKERGLTGA